MSEKKCGSCAMFMKGCRKRKTTNSCDKPICENYIPRAFSDVFVFGRFGGIRKTSL